CYDDKSSGEMKAKAYVGDEVLHLRLRNQLQCDDDNGSGEMKATTYVGDKEGPAPQSSKAIRLRPPVCPTGIYVETMSVGETSIPSELIGRAGIRNANEEPLELKNFGEIENIKK
ncbi:uncharacterized protein A4U43_C02F14360, partial [Asparagus officinalis]